MRVQLKYNICIERFQFVSTINLINKTNIPFVIQVVEKFMLWHRLNSFKLCMPNCCYYICLRYLFWIGVDDANCGVHLPEVDEGTGVEDLACCWCWKDCWNELNCWLMTDCCLWRLPPPNPPPPPFRRFLRRRRLFAKSHSFFKQFINKRALRPLGRTHFPSVPFSFTLVSRTVKGFFERKRANAKASYFV